LASYEIEDWFLDRKTISSKLVSTDRSWNENHPRPRV
jgi:hypothetical protein